MEVFDGGSSTGEGGSDEFGCDGGDGSGEDVGFEALGVGIVTMDGGSVGWRNRWVLKRYLKARVVDDGVC